MTRPLRLVYQRFPDPPLGFDSTRELHDVKGNELDGLVVKVLAHDVPDDLCFDVVPRSVGVRGDFLDAFSDTRHGISFDMRG